MKFTANDTYVLTNYTILDGTLDMKPQTKMSVFIRDGRIEKICAGNPWNDDFPTIDLEGKTLLPGLIDLHVHLAGSGKPVTMPTPKGKAGKSKGKMKVFDSMEHGFIHKGLVKNVKNQCLTKLYSGVTTIRSMGDLYWSNVENRDQINAGAYIGPRLLVSGICVSVPGGHMAGTMARACATIEDCEKAVDEAVSKSVDWIKIFVTGGVMDASDSGEPARLRMSLEMAQAACKRAHEKGYKVASHAESSEGVSVSLAAGVDNVEHGALMDEKIIALYKRNQASVTVTISPAIAIAALPEELTQMNSDQRKAGQIVMDGIIASAKQARIHGIPIGLGTDASCPYVTQYDMWREVCYYAKYCEVSNAEALHTATLGNAEILGLANETGSIEAGKSADLIVVAANPLEDLQVLRNVEKVIIQGNLIDQPKIKRMPKIDAALDKLL